MELIHFLKCQVRKYPTLARVLQPPTQRAKVAVRRFRMERWYGSRKLSPDSMGTWIRGRIANRTPTLIGKLGTLEMELLAHDNKRDRTGGRVPVPKELRRQAFVNVGLFPATDEALWRAFDEIRSALREIDGLAVHGEPAERRLVENDCRNVEVLCETGGLEPWMASVPWSTALEGKRVLVVHPFVDTIELQYRRHRERIWASRPGLLPDFELHTLRMPLSAGLRAPQERDWSERLDRMREGIERKTFDVALIGAGGMSLPLACHAKRMGAIGFHMGGATQLLFGICGRRWDDYEDINCFFNDSWTRPSAAETPETATLVEDGCYW